MPSIRLALAALAAGASLPAAAAPANYSDLWWNPQESGWGANIVHQGTTAFVTLFVYGPDGRPVWYVAPDAQEFALDTAGNPALRGPLYRTTGPWHGGPFDPAKVGREVVGRLVIEPRGDGRLVLDYEAEGVQAAKVVARQTFSQPDLGTTYHGSFRLRQVAPGAGAPWGTRDYAADILAHLDGANVFLRVSAPGGRCEYRGTREVQGRFATLTGQYACDGGEAGTFAVTDFEVTQHGFTGYLRTWSPANNQYGRFGGARY